MAVSIDRSSGSDIDLTDMVITVALQSSKAAPLPEGSSSGLYKRRQHGIVVEHALNGRIISHLSDIDGIVSIYYDDIVYTVYDNGLIICVIYYNASLTLIYYAHSGILIREKSQIFQISYLVP